MRHDQRYKSYTMPKLLLENMLREVPLKIRDLTAYAGHAERSLRVAKTMLKREGRTINDKVVDAHPENVRLQLKPLQDLYVLPAPYSKKNEVKRQALEKRVDAVLGDQIEAFEAGAVKSLSFPDLLQLVDAHIRSGGAGKDFLQAIKLRIEMASGEESPGPPVPLTPEGRIERGVRFLESLDPSEASEAFSIYEARRIESERIQALPSPIILSHEVEHDGIPSSVLSGGSIPAPETPENAENEALQP